MSKGNGWLVLETMKRQRNSKTVNVSEGQHFKKNTYGDLIHEKCDIIGKKSNFIDKIDSDGNE